MFEPVSKLGYMQLKPDGQAIVVLGDPPLRTLSAKDIEWHWNHIACGVLEGRPGIVRDVVRDLLGNPQIRAIVFSGKVAGREEWDDFFYGTTIPPWRIDNEHILLVRQFVNLYDDDFQTKDTMQPFWPTRVRYLE